MKSKIAKILIRIFVFLIVFAQSLYNLDSPDTILFYLAMVLGVMSLLAIKLETVELIMEIANNDRQ